ncbi:MAG: sulfite exporter TauE/SafE family protein [Myxococcales bacterium]|jgi:uncharacterized membrane protein YfcA
MGAPEAILLALAAFGGGALNAVAGGGSFLTFPALIFTGVAPIEANATSAVALWPGTLASILAYRRELLAERAEARGLALLSLVGGTLGALLLVNTPPAVFMEIVPFLLLAATLLFAFGDRLHSLQGRRGHHRPAFGLLAQLGIAVYGGYFGGGIGIMMLAAFALTGMTDIHRMNALKVLLTLAINGVAVVTFAVTGVVEWLPAALMIAGAVLGGYGGAALALRLDPRWVRRFVIALGAAMSAWFFIR